jgi:hypothetical protein
MKPISLTSRQMRLPPDAAPAAPTPDLAPPVKPHDSKGAAARPATGTSPRTAGTATSIDKPTVPPAKPGGRGLQARVQAVRKHASSRQARAGDRAGEMLHSFRSRLFRRPGAACRVAFAAGTTAGRGAGTGFSAEAESRGERKKRSGSLVFSATTQAGAGSEESESRMDVRQTGELPHLSRRRPRTGNVVVSEVPGNNDRMASTKGRAFCQATRSAHVFAGAFVPTPGFRRLTAWAVAFFHPCPARRRDWRGARPW